MSSTGSKISYLFEVLFFRSWWVWVFVLLCHLIYEQALWHRNAQVKQLQEQYENLQQSIRYEEARNEDLTRTLASQSDPAWIELTLMRVLGVVAEEQKKVFFMESPDKK